MQYIDVVDSEDGALLIADAEAIRLAWQGTEGDGFDYERACNLLIGKQGSPVALGNAQGIVWDMQGAGTADVLIDTPDRILIMRAWLDDPDEMKAIGKLAALPRSASTFIGTLSVLSGLLAVLSSVEDGACIQASDNVLARKDNARPTGDMSTESSGLLLKIPVGMYLCEHDEVELESGQSARRCFLLKQDI